MALGRVDGQGLGYSTGKLGGMSDDTHTRQCGKKKKKAIAAQAWYNDRAAERNAHRLDKAPGFLLTIGPKPKQPG